MNEVLTYVTQAAGFVLCCPTGGGHVVALTLAAAKQAHESGALEGYGEVLAQREELERFVAERELPPAAENPARLTDQELADLAFSVAGAASAPFMRDNPGYVMPADEIGALVRELLQERFGFDAAELAGYRGLGDYDDVYRLYVSEERTAMVRIWHNGQAELCLRDEDGAIWGPPVSLSLERITR